MPILKRTKQIALNLLLAALSAGVMVLLTLAADRALGFIIVPPLPPGTMQLIFPPFSEEVFETDEFSYTVETNALGMRDGLVGPKRADVCRIVVIGDSFTFGYGVNLEDTWVKRLQGLLTERGMAVEVLNLGEPGAAFPQYLETASRAIPILQPDLVIVAALQGDDLGSGFGAQPTSTLERVSQRVRAWYPNFIRVLQGEHWVAATEVSPPMRMLDAAQRREGQKAQAAEFVAGLSGEERARYEAIPESVRESFLAGNLNGALLSMAVHSPDFMANLSTAESGFVQGSVPGAAAILWRIGAIAHDAGAAVLLVPVPHGIYVNRAAWENYARLGFKVSPDFLTSPLPDEFLCEAAGQAGWPCLPVSQAFRDRVDDASLFYPRDGHLTVAGNECMARAVAAGLGAFLPAGCRP